MIFPVSHERSTARRWPIIATSIFLLCFAVECVLTVTTRGAEARIDGAERSVAGYYAAHPYLNLPPSARAELDADVVSLLRGAGPREPDADTVAQEQAELDALVAELDRARADDPFRRLGYVPAERNVLRLVTAPFVHTGWLHLIGNMWFLLLCGANLEDRWGRVVFLLFYLASGAAAALAEGLVRAASTVPVVGASGAIAGAMGAFLVVFGKTRVRFVAFVTLRPIFFTAPAFVMIPVWAAFEVVFGLLFRGDGTAHWAHVGGFAFGVVVALVLRRTGADRKLDDGVARAAMLGDDPRLDTARLLLARGKAQDALAMLEGLAQEKPRSLHVHEAIARAAEALGDKERTERARAKAEMLRAESA